MANRKLDKITAKVKNVIIKSAQESRSEKEFIDQSLKAYFTTRLQNAKSFKNKFENAYNKKQFNNIKEKPEEFYNHSINNILTKSNENMQNIKDKTSMINNKKSKQITSLLYYSPTNPRKKLNNEIIN